MLQEFQRAVALTAPQIAFETPGLAFEGYWLDEKSYFFIAERFDESLRRIVVVPSVLDVRKRTVRRVVELDNLASLLTERTGSKVDLAALSFAKFGLFKPNTLGVSFGKWDGVLDLLTGRVIEMHPATEMPAAHSPCHRYACIVKGSNLALRDHTTGVERRLTADGEPDHRYGQQPDTCLAPISYRKRPTPVGLWSADSRWFLTHRIDERGVVEQPLIQHVPPGGGRAVLHRYRLPLPGERVPTMTLVGVNVDSGGIIQFREFGCPVSNLSPFSQRWVWFSGSDRASLIRFDRYRQHVDLIELDLSRGTGRIVLTESIQTGWIDLNPMGFRTPNVRTLPASNEIIWYSERDGWGHLYLYDSRTGALKNQITRGEWLVRDIVHVDETHRKVLFLAGGLERDSDPVRRALCSADLDGSGFQVLHAIDGDVFVAPTEPCGLSQEHRFGPGYHQPGISPDGRFAVMAHRHPAKGNFLRLLSIETGQSTPIASVAPRQDDAVVRAFSALAADGVTPLYGTMFLPSDFDEGENYPLIDYIYPGPQRSHQPQRYRAMDSALAASLAQLGFVVVMLDTRATPGRSRAFHKLGFGALLEPQLADHAAVVKELRGRYLFIRGDRSGIYGWSGGGAAAARALFDYGDVFDVGVAACGNHDSSLYAAAWSDRYRGPQDTERWREQDNASAAHRLRGKLLLISGDMDENVPVSQTLRLANALIEAQRDFDLVIVPNAGHDVLNTSGYALRRVWEYFLRHLRDESLPTDVRIDFTADALERYGQQLEREFRQ